MSGGAPLSYLTGSGSRSADALETLAWGFSAISVAVVGIIALLIGFAIRRSRTRASGPDGNQVGREEGGLALIWWGVGISLPVLLAMAVWNFLTTRLLAEAPGSPALSVKVTGHRWWWEIRYDDDTSRAVSTANEMVIPVGVPVRLQLASGDVIHDFWVPKLGPKMDMIPGRTNQTWLEADRPGLYRGQCAEYCGLQHAHMAFLVRAVAPAEFYAWLDHQREPAAGPPRNIPNAGLTDEAQSEPPGVAAEPPSPDAALFATRCGACHAVRGTDTGGILGPDLTHFGSRGTIAAGLLSNTPVHLAQWLAEPQRLKPGTLMPQVQLTSVERARLVSYLEGLS